MLKKLIITSLLFFSISAFAQDSTRSWVRTRTWLLTQLAPSPFVMHDANQTEGRLIGGLRWNIIPLNFSFSTNEYVSPAQFFFINPVRKFSGSIELFVQPELSLASIKYGEMDKFALATGSRITIPLKQRGEHLSMSIGGKYTFRKDKIGENNGYWGIETGIYAIFNMMGLQFNYNFDNRTRYDIGIYFKFF